jgi:hypothetical protein
MFLDQLRQTCRLPFHSLSSFSQFQNVNMLSVKEIFSFLNIFNQKYSFSPNGKVQHTAHQEKDQQCSTVLNTKIMICPDFVF